MLISFLGNLIRTLIGGGSAVGDFQYLILVESLLGQESINKKEITVT